MLLRDVETNHGAILPKLCLQRGPLGLAGVCIRSSFVNHPGHLGCSRYPIYLHLGHARRTMVSHGVPSKVLCPFICRTVAASTYLTSRLYVDFSSEMTCTDTSRARYSLHKPGICHTVADNVCVTWLNPCASPHINWTWALNEG